MGQLLAPYRSRTPLSPVARARTVFTGVRASSQLRLSMWFSMVDGMAGVVLAELACAWMQFFAVLEAALRCTAVLADAVACGQQPRAALLLSPSAWLSAAAFVIVSSDTTAEKSYAVDNPTLYRVVTTVSCYSAGPNNCLVQISVPTRILT